MRRNKYKQLCLSVLLVAYAVVMLWLLFGQRTAAKAKYDNLNLVPFTTLRLYLDMFRNSSNGYLVRHAFVNLVGNVIMFIPLGYLLPAIWKKAQNFFTMLFYAVTLIVIIETVQYITGLGSCDIDDLILNLPGVMFGWCIRSIGTKKHK